MAEIRETSTQKASGGQDVELKITEDLTIGDISTGIYPGGIPVEGGEGWLVHWARSPELAGHIVCDGQNGCGVVASDPPEAPHEDPDRPTGAPPDIDALWVTAYDREGIAPGDYARRLIREHAVRVHGAVVYGGPVLEGE